MDNEKKAKSSTEKLQWDKKPIPLSQPHLSGEEQKYLKEAFETNWVGPLGPNVVGFEEDIISYTGCKSALALSSGTAAIHLALRYLGVSSDDIVFCSSLTFAASCNPILYQNAIPVFIDSEPGTWNMSAEALEKAFIYQKGVNKMPKAVILVDLYGQTADIDKISDICQFYNVPVIEDSAEALGSKYKGNRCGTFGKFGVYSFNGNKIITTGGGGMLVSDDNEAINKCRFWSTQARDNAPYYEHSEYGYNYRLSNVLAGIGRGQMEILDKRIEKKKEINKIYLNEFKSIDDISMMPTPKFNDSNYWLSVIQIEQKSRVSPTNIIQRLADEKIESRHVWKPMHLQPLYKQALFYKHKSMDYSRLFFESGVCLPSDTSLTETELEKVIYTIKHCF